MKRNEAYELAREIKEDLKDYGYNNPQTPYYTVHEFEMDGVKFNVFVSVWKQEDEEDGHRIYAVWSGVEYDGGDNVWADYEYSTNNMRLTELADSLYTLANYYKKEEHLEELRKMIDSLDSE